MVYTLLLGVIGTYVFISHIQPYLDLHYQIYKSKQELELGREELEFNAEKCELYRAYPELLEHHDDTNRVGFDYCNCQSEYSEDDEDDEDDVEWKDIKMSKEKSGSIYSEKTNKIGF